MATAATAAFTAAVAPAGEFAGQEPDGEEEGELPEWDPSGSYDEDGEEGQWELHGEDPDAHLPPTEEELAEAEILRQGKVRAVCWPQGGCSCPDILAFSALLHSFQILCSHTVIMACSFWAFSTPDGHSSDQCIRTCCSR